MSVPFRILGALTIVVAALGYAVAQPTLRANRASPVTVDPVRLRMRVDTLAADFHPRDWRHPANLAKCADYITGELAQAGACVTTQEIRAAGAVYRNVIGRFGVGRGNRIVVGAHYDAFGATPGADDNASGVASLIELAYLLGRHAPDAEVELVAYVLEEPPFFQTESMGSAVHAASLARDGAGIRGVIVLEMVGYFSDVRGSQSYPVPLLRLFYPGRANFIGIVGRWDQGDWIKTVKTGMKGATDLPVRSIRAPSAIQGVDFSDHASYWSHGINAVMVTDTSFYRNKAYHTAADTPATLDYTRMAKTVVAVFETTRFGR
jgi:hypothetical protein